MAQDILFFAEQRDGAFRRSAFEAATAARGLADAAGGKVHGVVVGDGVQAMAADLGRYGADEVHVVEDSRLANAPGRAVADAVLSVCQAVSPSVVVFVSSTTGRDVAPRVAALLQTGYISDAIAVSTEGGVQATKPMFSGKVQAQITFKGDGPGVLGIRPNVFTPKEAPRDASVSSTPFAPSDKAFSAEVVEVKTESGDRVSLAEARVVVSGGRGVKGPENFPIIQELADALGGAMGASRAAVDAGWIEHAHQVGQTGRTVSPDLYVACGISGAIQHLAGMSSSRVIVAINKDPEAPIFSVADYGIVGDLFEIVPAMTAKVKELTSQ